MPANYMRYDLGTATISTISPYQAHADNREYDRPAYAFLRSAKGESLFGVCLTLSEENMLNKLIHDILMRVKDSPARDLVIAK